MPTASTCFARRRTIAQGRDELEHRLHREAALDSLPRHLEVLEVDLEHFGESLRGRFEILGPAHHYDMIDSADVVPHRHRLLLSRRSASFFRFVQILTSL